MERQLDTSRIKDGRVIALCTGSLAAGFLAGMLIFGKPWHLPPAWGDIPTWITGVATAVLAIFAIVTAWYARQAFLKQSQEVADQAKMLKVQSEQLAEQRRINAEQTEVLKLQATELRESIDERKREAERRHRDQASRVFIWQEYREGDPAQYHDPPDYIAHLGPVPHGESRPLMVAHVKNTSDQPVYDLIVRWTVGNAFRSESRRSKPLMPGEEDIQLELMRPGEDPSLFNAVAFFRDANKVHWHAYPDGQFDVLQPGEENARLSRGTPPPQPPRSGRTSVRGNRQGNTPTPSCDLLMRYVLHNLSPCHWRCFPYGEEAPGAEVCRPPHERRAVPRLRDQRREGLRGAWRRAPQVKAAAALNVAERKAEGLLAGILDFEPVTNGGLLTNPLTALQSIAGRVVRLVEVLEPVAAERTRLARLPSEARTPGRALALRHGPIGAPGSPGWSP